MRPIQAASGRWPMTASDSTEGTRWGVERQQTAQRLRFTAQQVQLSGLIHWPTRHQVMSSDVRKSVFEACCELLVDSIATYSIP